MDSRAVALMGVGYGSRALATNGLWWVAEVVNNLPEEVSELLFADIDKTILLDAGTTIINLVKEAGMATLVDNLIAKRPPVEMRAKMSKTTTIRTRTNMNSGEIIKATTRAVIRLVSKLEGECK